MAEELNIDYFSIVEGCDIPRSTGVLEKNLKELSEFEYLRQELLSTKDVKRYQYSGYPEGMITDALSMHLCRMVNIVESLQNVAFFQQNKILLKSLSLYMIWPKCKLEIYALSINK